MSMLRAAGSHTLIASGPLALRPRLSTGLSFLFHILIIPPPGWECQMEVDLFCRNKSKKNCRPNPWKIYSFIYKIYLLPFNWELMYGIIDFAINISNYIPLKIISPILLTER